MTNPQVTVYVPTRNRADLLRSAVLSVMEQSFNDLEIIIVDDASTDDTPNVIAELAEQDPRIRSIRLQIRSGACAARNAAIEAARGRWCTGIDDDDLMLPNRIATLLDVAIKKDRYSLICSSFFVERKTTRRKLYRRRAVITLDDLLHRNIIGNQALFRRDHALSIGGFDIEMPASQDYDFWTRLVEAFGPALRIPESTYVLREHEHVTTRITKTQSAHLGALRYTAKHRHLMTQRHLQSQRLIQHYVAGEALTLGLAASSINFANFGFLMRYAAQQLPLLASIRDRLN
jgi:glycosyltransferase involved in cell wall biosynthesis